MVRRCTYRAPPSGIQGDDKDDLVEEEDDVGRITATILVFIIVKISNTFKEQMFRCGPGPGESGFVINGYGSNTGNGCRHLLAHRSCCQQREREWRKERKRIEEREREWRKRSCGLCLAA